MIYDDLKQFITDKMYTYTECQNMLNNYYKHKQLTDDQYDELMELAKELEANSADDELMGKINAMAHEIESLKQDVEALKNQSEIPPSAEDGSESNPFVAYRGMTYIKGKYYLDTSDNKIYLCVRNDIEGGQELNYLPSELKNNYFKFVKNNK